MKIGVISDTHGVLRPEARRALRGSELILHAGDVGAWEILRDLRQIAPVVAVRGNIDTAGWAKWLHATEIAECAERSLYVLHNIAELDLNPKAAGFAAVIYGHSHKANIEWKNGVLFFNPGSAGPRRFSLPVSIGLLTIDADGLQPRLVTLP